MGKQELHTKSAIVDRVKEVMRMNKTLECPIAGDNYYKIIDNGILHSQEIKISLSDFDEELKEILDNEKPEVIQSIIFRAIIEIAREKFGTRNYTDLIKWRFI